MADAREILLRNILTDIAKEQNYDNFELKVKGLPPTGANFTSQLFHSTISAPSKTDLNVFAKVSVVGETMREQMPFNFFIIEAYVYNKLLKIYKQLEEDNMVPEEHRLISPKYYGSSEKRLEEVLVLEDLSTQGYITQDRLTPIDWEYASKAVEELAKLHALSIAFQAKYPEDYEEASRLLQKEPPSDSVGVMFEQMFQSVVGKIDEKYREKLQQFMMPYKNVENILNFYVPLKHSMLVHGDFRMSNLMHKVDENGQLQVVVIDYQTMCAGNPSSDLLYFIFSGTDAEFRKKHYQQLIDHYYEQLSLAVTRLHLDINQVYPRKDFDEEYKQMAPFGLLISIMLLPMVTVDIEHVQEENEGLETMSKMLHNTNQIGVQRIQEVVADYVRWDLL